MITWENYEEYMVMHADGELTAEQEQALMSFLYEHPDLQGELTAFTMTKMIPEATETYAHKENLLRPETAAKPIVVALPVWRRYAAAAAVAALLAVPGYKYFMQPTVSGLQESPSVAVVVPSSTLPAATRSASQEPIEATPADNAPESAIPAQTATAAVPTVPTSDIRPVRTPRNIKGTRNNIAPAANTIAKATHSDALAMADISPLEVGSAKMIETSEKKFVPAVTNAPSVAIEYTESDDESVAAGSLLDRVPMSDTRRSGMKSFAADVATGYSKVSNVTQEIAQASLSFKIVKKQLKVSF